MNYPTIGIDEAGRGPLAGPLSVCGLSILNTDKIHFFHDERIRDSKKLSEKRRQEIFLDIQREARAGNLKYVVSFISPEKIDEVGMSASLKIATSEILNKFGANEATKILLDGSLRAPDIFLNQQTIIKGDETELSIALASIVAKVLRDEKMLNLAKEYPVYGFDKHKGYGTKLHREAITKFGLSPQHRKTFCRNILT